MTSSNSYTNTQKAIKNTATNQELGQPNPFESATPTMTSLVIAPVVKHSMAIQFSLECNANESRLLHK